jgi:heme exporter protein A
MLAFRNVTFTLEGKKLFDDASALIPAGHKVGFVGRNGSGKTTLLRALALLVRSEAGTILWQGANVQADPETWRGQLAWLGHLDGLKGDLTVRENLLGAERVRGRPAADDRLDLALIALDLHVLVHRPVRTLSAGQRRRTALARVMLTQAPLWLLDEPLTALDAVAQQAFRTVLQQHLAHGGLAIAATHADLGVPGARTFELSAPQKALP